MSNNSSTAICWQPDWFWKVGDNVNFIQYAIVLPVYATLGLLGHVICASAFLKQAKNEKAYVYQIFLEITQCFNNVMFSVYLMASLGSGIERAGYRWYQQSYILMWYAAHLAIPLSDSFEACCLLLSVSMAADRAFALFKPFVYKTIDNKKHQAVALTMSITLGFGITFFNIRLFEVQTEDDHYIIGVDEEFVGTLTSTVLSHACNATRMIGLLILILCNVSIVRNFKKHMAQKSKLTASQSSTNDKVREAKEKATEKTLLLLTITQSFFTAVSMFSLVVFYTAVYLVPLFNVCDHLLYAPLLNCIVMVSDMGNTWVIMVLNRKSREIFLKTLCFLKYWKRIRVGSDNGTSVMAVSQSRHGTT